VIPNDEMSAQSLMSVMMPKRRPEMIDEVVSYAAKFDAKSPSEEAIPWSLVPVLVPWRRTSVVLTEVVGP